MDSFRKALDRAMYTSIFYTPENILKITYALNLMRNAPRECKGCRVEILREMGFSGIFALIFLGPPAVSIVASLLSDALGINYPAAFMNVRFIQKHLVEYRKFQIPTLGLVSGLMAFAYGLSVEEFIEYRSKNPAPREVPCDCENEDDMFSSEPLGDNLIKPRGSTAKICYNLTGENEGLRLWLREKGTDPMHSIPGNSQVWAYDHCTPSASTPSASQRKRQSRRKSRKSRRKRRKSRKCVKR